MPRAIGLSRAMLIGELLALIALLLPTLVLAQEPGLLTYAIGDLPLESGEVIREFKIAYMTESALNATKSNAVLMVTAIGGNHHRIDFLIGPGRGIDTDHLLVIKTNDRQRADLVAKQQHLPARGGVPALDPPGHG
jgi:hypothetical protein